MQEIFRVSDRTKSQDVRKSEQAIREALNTAAKKTGVLFSDEGEFIRVATDRPAAQFFQEAMREMVHLLSEEKRIVSEMENLINTLGRTIEIITVICKLADPNETTNKILALIRKTIEHLKKYAQAPDECEPAEEKDAPADQAAEDSHV